MPFRFLIVMLLIGCAQSQCLTVNAQTTFEDTDLIPKSAVAVVYVKLSEILADPTMELVPHELLSAWGKQEFGLDLCKVRNATLLIDEIVRPNDPPNFAVILRFDEDQKLNDDLISRGKELELKGKPLYIFSRRDDVPALYVPDSSTVIFGMKPFIEKMLSPNERGGLFELINNSAAEDHISAFACVEPMLPFIEANVPPKSQFPWQYRQFRDLPEQVESMSLRLNFSENPANELKVTAINEEAGKKVMKTVQQGLSMARGMMMTSIAQQMRNQPGMLEAIEAYDTRVGDRIESLMMPTIEGRTLTFKMENNQQVSNGAVVGTLMGMLIPATYQARMAARRVGAMNKLRQIALASLNYESAYMHFPKNITDKDGKPLLSWRVAILPFLEENDLYKQFRLDEPWDSEHNIKLLDRMPEIYSNLQFDSDSKTVFQGFEGPGTIFEPGKNKIGFGNITDGSSNTILCVESNAENAVEWSKPSDLPFDPKEKVTQVGDLRPSGFNAALCDGSVHTISKTVDQKTLNSAIDRSDGNIIDIGR